MNPRSHMLHPNELSRDLKTFLNLEKYSEKYVQIHDMQRNDFLRKWHEQNPNE